MTTAVDQHLEAGTWEGIRKRNEHEHIVKLEADCHMKKLESQLMQSELSSIITTANYISPHYC